MKKFYLFVAATLALSGCSSDEFLGDSPSSNSEESDMITFNGVKPNMLRAVGGATAADRLDYKFNVFGTKTIGSEPAINVFALGSTATIPNEQTYFVWYNSSLTNQTMTNKEGWDYVGPKDMVLPGGGSAKLLGEQTIKYWDHAAGQYDFVAYANTKGATITNVTTEGFDVKATAAQMANLYLADKKIVPNADFRKNVQMTFRAGGSKVRFGIYETIPGYEVKNVTFLYNDGVESSTTHAWLNGGFVGDPVSAYDFKVTYDGDKKAVVAGVDASFAKIYNFGTFDSSVALGTTSASPTWASGAAEYINVLPNTVNVKPMVLWVHYELYNSTTGEVIRVSNAQAVVPVNYMTWKPNHAYTYIFKISDNTNGYTGSDPSKPGLYPISFDAVVEETTTNETQGTTSTVASPSIITYQGGSVSGSGIAYTTSTQPIYVQVVGTAGVTQNLVTIPVHVYKVAAGTTEAQCQLGTAVLGAEEGISVGTTDLTIDGTNIKLLANEYASMQLATGTYAFEYTDAAGVKHYKVIVVE